MPKVDGRGCGGWTCDYITISEDAKAWLARVGLAATSNQQPGTSSTRSIGRVVDRGQIKIDSVAMASLLRSPVSSTRGRDCNPFVEAAGSMGQSTAERAAHQSPAACTTRAGPLLSLGTAVELNNE